MNDIENVQQACTRFGLTIYYNQSKLLLKF